MHLRRCFLLFTSSKSAFPSIHFVSFWFFQLRRSTCFSPSKYRSSYPSLRRFGLAFPSAISFELIRLHSSRFSLFGFGVIKPAFNTAFHQVSHHFVFISFAFYSSIHLPVLTFHFISPISGFPAFFSRLAGFTSGLVLAFRPFQLEIVSNFCSPGFRRFCFGTAFLRR